MINIAMNSDRARIRCLKSICLARLRSPSGPRADAIDAVRPSGYEAILRNTSHCPGPSCAVENQLQTIQRDELIGMNRLLPEIVFASAGIAGTGRRGAFGASSAFSSLRIAIGIRRQRPIDFTAAESAGRVAPVAPAVLRRSCPDPAHNQNLSAASPPPYCNPLARSSRSIRSEPTRSPRRLLAASPTLQPIGGTICLPFHSRREIEIASFAHARIRWLSQP